VGGSAGVVAGKTVETGGDGGGVDDTAGVLLASAGLGVLLLDKALLAAIGSGGDTVLAEFCWLNVPKLLELLMGDIAIMVVSLSFFPIRHKNNFCVHT
jgi:hypothetical protein